MAMLFALNPVVVFLELESYTSAEAVGMNFIRTKMKNEERTKEII